ncbi:hypothetical protein [Tenacibaculum dicentrarchi]|uniref:hypothetical protein n=1 Tax=Tenacibaculum dicentrarchi TaxID=669041 RepID=UPI000C7B2285|nr:conserved hypothetical protein [Tenacibaculum dicentrarchi]
MAPEFNNNEQHLLVQNFLAKKIEDDGYEWDYKKSKIMDATIYANTEVSVGATFSMLDGETNGVVGITNLNGNKLNKGRPIVLCGIGLGFAVGAGEQKPHALDFEYSKTHHDLKFANLIIKQSNEILFKEPISSIMNNLKDGSKYSELGSFVLLVDETDIDIEIEYPKTLKSTLTGTDKLYVSFMAKAKEVYLKR